MNNTANKNLFLASLDNFQSDDINETELFCNLHILRPMNSGTVVLFCSFVPNEECNVNTFGCWNRRVNRSVDIMSFDALLARTKQI